MEFKNTSSNMVQAIDNIITGYKMGPMRALAQEPVQNALDAKRKGQSCVFVEYRLLRRQTREGDDCYLLAVTDSGTTGLRGPMVSEDELRQRDYKLSQEENWAAFEAQGYKKENEDALGSRGQGKTAFLYHSHVPGDARRMVMLYDTLLESGEYRFGMRYARPIDQIMSPPLFDDKAKQQVKQESVQFEGVDVPLGLEALTEIGTRVIVPFLASEELPALRPGGELSRWLQRCWWRAIQLGRLRILVVDDERGDTEDIVVPSWWQDLPRDRGKPSKNGRWHELPDGRQFCRWRDLPLGDGPQIRELVLLHSDAVSEDEIISDYPEYAGIQLLRGSQWIETRGVKQEYGDFVPVDKRPGFRGYVEFNKQADSLLRSAENSQHDGFDARGKNGEIVRELRHQLDERVREFSDEMGWESAQPVTVRQVTQREKATHTKFLETFLNPNGRKPKPITGTDSDDGMQILWDCHLTVKYPESKSTRVDWGQSIRDVRVEVEFEPGDALEGSADLVLEWLDVNDKATELYRLENALSKEWDCKPARAQFELGDWQILRGKASRERQINCPEPGDHKLRAVVEYNGVRVKSAARTVYVQAEPPPPPTQHPFTLSVIPTNASDGEQRRIEHGQVLQVDIFARNRTTESTRLFLNASLQRGGFAEVFAQRMPVDLQGTPAGDAPARKMIFSVSRRLLDPYQSIPLNLSGIQSLTMPESSGQYSVSADLLDESGAVVARMTASQSTSSATLADARTTCLSILSSRNSSRCG